MLELPAELTQQQASACLARLLQGLRAQTQPDVVVDARALTHFDSSALAVLLACRRESLAAGKTFSAQHLPAKLMQLAGLYGVAGLLTQVS
jgi:phospholipid transport system transporter-binding protein